ncbi:efflux RND transporter periplasmic adaptor subunit [uncultured Thiodictyon sp.]|uniref:efflux RND transporter periplasmic adaptor subunit n=1 Tax=uncultured Thiodictyon sp. TaxID=1846217 RepID=UPI0025F13B45|nr:efflux RND transporter periplasmic adaptor subunit [uncultured Thiodictyon sp.]
MGNGKQLILLALLVVTLAGLGYMGWKKFSSVEASATAIAAGSAPTQHPAPDTLRFPADAPQLTFLQIMPVEARPEPLVEPLNARIIYNDNVTARIFSPLAGRVTKISVEPGQQVKTGGELAALDSPDYAQAVADRLKAQADVLHKHQVFERSTLLYEAKGLARKELEAAEADWHQAEAEEARAKARMKNLSASSPNESGQFILRAPISGTVTERQINVGSEVRTDATIPLFVITDPTRLWVQVDLPEQQLNKVEIGRLMTIEVDAYPGEVFRGRVSVIAGALDPVTRRIQVRCEVDDPSRRLKPEMFARAAPIQTENGSLPRVPNAALFTQGLYSFLFVESSPGVLQRRRVVPSSQGSEFTYIKYGLAPGERVVTTGALLLNSELAGNE